MQRRKFLGIVSIGAGATTLPMWLSTAFKLDDPACDDTSAAIDLGALGLDAAHVEVRRFGPPLASKSHFGRQRQNDCVREQRRTTVKVLGDLANMLLDLRALEPL